MKELLNKAGFANILLDTMATIVVILDGDGKIVAFNRACEQLTGYTSDEVRDRSVQDIFVLPEEMEGVVEALRLLLDGVAPIYHTNFWLTRSREKRLIEWSASGMKDETGKVQYILATGIEVTERNAKEMALRESERRFSTLFQSSPAAICIIQIGPGTVLDTNPAFERLSGYSRAELVGKRLEHLGILETTPENAKILEEALGSREPLNRELSLVARDGTRHYLAVSLARAELGGQNCLITSSFDISTRRLYEERILRSNEQLEHRVQERTYALAEQIEEKGRLQDKLSQLLRASPVVIYSSIPYAPYFISYVSENVEEQFGYRPDQLQFVPGIWHKLDFAGDLPKSEEVVKLLQAQDGNLTLEWRLRKSDGSACWVQENLRLIVDKHGKPIEIHGAFQNISARREYEEAIRKSEELYRHLAEAAHDFIFVISKDDRIEYVNSFAASNFGLAPEKMVGQSRDQLFPIETSKHQQQALDRVMLEDRDAYYEEFTQFPGFTMWLGTKLVPIHNEKGEVIAVMGVARDITERKRNEEVLKASLKAQQDLNNLRSEVLRTITHQFGTPLSTILSSTENLEAYAEKWPQEKRQAHLNKIKNASKHLATMVRDMLDIERGESGAVKNSPKLLDLAHFCRQLIEKIGTNDEENHLIQFTQKNTIQPCWMDENLLFQILENILTNAIKYSPSGSQVQMDLELSGRQVVFLVKDHGIGISAEDQKHLFTPFYRGYNVAQITGTGLGLLLVRKSVDLMGGSLRIDSLEGVGTSVTIRLPYLLAREDQGDV